MPVLATDGICASSFRLEVASVKAADELGASERLSLITAKPMYVCEVRLREVSLVRKTFRHQSVRGTGANKWKLGVALEFRQL